MKNHLPPILALIVAAGILNLPSLRYGYLLEDYYYLRSYSLKEIAISFHSHWEPRMAETKGFRPLHTVHYAFFHWLIGGSPAANHVLNLGLHLTGILLLYALVWRSSRNSSAAFWSALIYGCLGSTAWHATQLTNRQHLLMVIFLFTSLICYDRYLLKRSRPAWIAGLACFLGALLLKETAVTFPVIIGSFALIVRKEKPSGQIRPLLPYFLLLVLFLCYRHAVLAPLPDTFAHPPAPPDTPGRMISDYSHGLLASLLQSHGLRDPSSPDYPAYARGVRDTRSVLALISLTGFLLPSLILLFRRGSEDERRTFFLGLAIILIANTMVAVWYRTNRLFITTTGTAILTGSLAAATFSALARPAARKVFLAAVAAGICFGCYLAVNLHTYLEIQWGLRPDGHIATTWDSWLVDEGYFPYIKEEQMLILKEKLRLTGSRGHRKSLPNRQESNPPNDCDGDRRRTAEKQTGGNAQKP